MRLTAPLAILLGLSIAGLFTAVGVFLALRTNHADTYARVAGLPMPDPHFSPSPSAPASASLRGSLKDEAGRALAAQHDALVGACWTPLAKNPPEVQGVSFLLRLGFDSEGKQATKGELLSRVLARPDITACVGRELQPLEVPPGLGPGNVELKLFLP